MSKTEPNLLIEHRGAIAIVTLNRPDKRNALRETLWHDLKNTFEGFGPDVRASCSPAPASILRRPRFVGAPASRSLREHFHVALRTRYTRCIQFGGRPVVTAMQGAVIGGGLEVATATHVRVADATTFYQLPEGRRGFYVGGGASVRVAKIIGSGRMVEMMLTGRTLDAEAGERLGLSHYLVEPGKSLEKAIELAGKHRQERPHPELSDRPGDPAHCRYVGVRRPMDRERGAGREHDLGRRPCRHRCVLRQAQDRLLERDGAQISGVTSFFTPSSALP